MAESPVLPQAERREHVIVAHYVIAAHLDLGQLQRIARCEAYPRGGRRNGEERRGAVGLIRGDELRREMATSQVPGVSSIGFGMDVQVSNARRAYGDAVVLSPRRARERASMSATSAPPVVMDGPLRQPPSATDTAGQGVSPYIAL
jgi:hypothetical protein